MYVSVRPHSERQNVLLDKGFTKFFRLTDLNYLLNSQILPPSQDFQFCMNKNIPIELYSWNRISLYRLCPLDYTNPHFSQNVDNISIADEF